VITGYDYFIVGFYLLFILGIGLAFRRMRLPKRLIMGRTRSRKNEKLRSWRGLWAHAALGHNSKAIHDAYDSRSTARSATVETREMAEGVGFVPKFAFFWWYFARFLRLFQSIPPLFWIILGYPALTVLLTLSLTVLMGDSPLPKTRGRQKFGLR
jgi:hypothetical protein